MTPFFLSFSMRTKLKCLIWNARDTGQAEEWLRGWWNQRDRKSMGTSVIGLRTTGETDWMCPERITSKDLVSVMFCWCFNQRPENHCLSRISTLASEWTNECCFHPFAGLTAFSFIKICTFALLEANKSEESLCCKSKVFALKFKDQSSSWWIVSKVTL